MSITRLAGKNSVNVRAECDVVCQNSGGDDARRGYQHQECQHHGQSTRLERRPPTVVKVIAHCPSFPRLSLIILRAEICALINTQAPEQTGRERR